MTRGADNFDYGTMRWARCLTSSYTQTTFSLQIQTEADTIPGIANTSEAPIGDVMGPWCLSAPPAVPTTDSAGLITAACEVLISAMGDDNIVTAMRDTRFAKYAADLLAGEAALFNAFGVRMFLREKQAGLAAFGGSLLFDKASKSIAITGIPSSDGGSAPWLTLTSTGIGCASSSGASSLNIDGDSATLTASGVNINGRSVAIGSNASDPVVTLSYLSAVLSQLTTQFATHMHPTAGTGPPSPPTLPLFLTPQGSKTVKASL